MKGHTVILRGPRRARSADDPARIKTCGHCGQPFHKDKRNTWAYWERAKYCSQRCSAQARSEMAAARRAPLAASFERWIDKTDNCWRWTGALDRDGYGIFSYGGKSYRAAIVALDLDGRKPARGQYACHHCDNPPCVNPAHLYPGTPIQNVADKVERKRHCHGSAHYAARLTEDQVRAIRAADGSHANIGARFGVSASNVTIIKSRKTWRHVP